MEKEQKNALCDQLKTVDDSLLFLFVLVASILLSLWSVFIQRKGLCLTICGRGEEAERLPGVFPLKCRASAMVVGALGFFLCLALRTEQALGEDTGCVAKRSARINVLASVLVLLAALLRFDDLRLVERCQAALVNEDTLPD